MVEFSRRHPECERAQSLASLALDGELTEVDELRLEAHLRECAVCALHVREVRALTTALRAAPLESWGRRFEHPRRPAAASRRRTLVLRGAVAASLVALSAGLGVFAGSLAREPAEPTRTAPPAPEVALLERSEARELRDLRRVKEPPRREPRRFTGV